MAGERLPARFLFRSQLWFRWTRKCFETATSHMQTVVEHNNMTREELVEIGRRIVECNGTEQEIDDLSELFDKNVPHPNGSNLFFYPENYNARKDNISDYNPTVEEVVDKCLSYKTIQL